MAFNSRYRRPQNASHPATRQDQVELSIDPIDDQVQMLHQRVGLLKNVALEIDNETKEQNRLLSQLEDSMARAGSGLKTSMKRLTRAITQGSSNHVLHVVLFSLACFLFVYLYLKFR